MLCSQRYIDHLLAFQKESDGSQEPWQKTVSDLQKQLKDKEEREAKFKQLALRAKKEAADIKKQVNDSQSHSCY